MTIKAIKKIKKIKADIDNLEAKEEILLEKLDEAEFPNPDAWGDLDWLSEEKYNLMKEKYNNMPKKKKLKKKKKKAKAKKKKRK